MLLLPPPLHSAVSRPTVGSSDVLTHHSSLVSLTECHASPTDGAAAACSCCSRPLLASLRMISVRLPYVLRG